MGYIEGHSRDQMLLLPASVDDYVGADNPVRFIAAFVDDLDLGELGFGRSRPKATGRPGYDPADLLKLYLYGYLNRVRSSRCLATETTRNLEVIWLLGGLRPDFRTIADFRRTNRAAFKPLFRSFVLLCRRLDLFGAGTGGGGWDTAQGGKQPQAQLHPPEAGRMDQARRRADRGVSDAPRPGRSR